MGTVKPSELNSNKDYMWEPDVDYEDEGMHNNDNLKRPEPLQTIGDIFFDRREFNPGTYNEYTHDKERQATGHPSHTDPSSQHHEEDAEGNPKTFKRVLVRFAERTSMQGVPYIYVSHVWYAKLGWSLLFLVGFGMMTAHLYLLFQEFYQYDTHSTVTLGFSTLTFPAVTICNVNPIKRSKVYLATPELQTLIETVQPSNIAGSMEEERNKMHDDMGGGEQTPPEGNGSPPEESGSPPEQSGPPPEKKSARRRRSIPESEKQKLLKRYKRFIDGFDLEESNTRYKNDDPPGEDGQGGGLQGNKSTIRAIEDEFRFLYSTMGREARQEMGHDITDMLMECTFRGITCDASHFRLVQTAQYGNCYTIENDNFVSTIGGPDDGLTLYLFLQDEEYLHGITNSMGFQVHIHNIGALPNPYSEGLSVSAGMETFIGLKQVNIERQKDPYGDCIENENFESVYGFAYTQKTCQSVCIQKTIMEECGCFDAEKDEEFKSIPRTSNPSNGSERMHPCKDSTQSTCLRAIQRQFQSEELECDCPSPCSESLFSKALSSKIWPTSQYASILVEYLCSLVNETTCQEYKEKSRSEIASSFLKMVIYFEDLNYENITEEVDYETFQFVSDVGGTIGLWIGLSMISFFEVIQFMYEMAHYVFYMKPKLARERARKLKLRHEKHDVVQALRIVNTSGLLPMTTATAKLMSSGSGSLSGGQGLTLPKAGPGSAGDSGRGADSLSSGGNDEHHLISGKSAQNGPRAIKEPLWHSESSGLKNLAYEGGPLYGLRGMGLMVSPPAYLSAGDTGIDSSDLNVEFTSQKC